MTGIYKITSPSGKIYIGQSINVFIRIRKYRSINTSKRQVGLHNSFLKYGISEHVFEIVEECSEKSLNERERYWQEFYDVIKFGLNCKTTSYSGNRGELSLNTKLKMSESLKGRIISEDQRKKLSVAGKGRKCSKKAIDKLKEYNKNRIFSEEIKEKIARNNPTSLLILDVQIGVFYYSVADLSRTLNVNPSTLFDTLKGRRNIKNKTQFKIV